MAKSLTEQEIFNAVYDEANEQLSTSVGVANSGATIDRTVQEILNAVYDANNAKLNAN